MGPGWGVSGSFGAVQKRCCRGGFGGPRVAVSERCNRSGVAERKRNAMAMEAIGA